MAVIEGVKRPFGGQIGVVYFDVAASGSLVFLRGPATTVLQNDVAILDSERGLSPLRLPVNAYVSPRLSPDGNWQTISRSQSGRQLASGNTDRSGPQLARGVEAARVFTLNQLAKSDERRPASDERGSASRLKHVAVVRVTFWKSFTRTRAWSRFARLDAPRGRGRAVRSPELAPPRPAHHHVELPVRAVSDAFAQLEVIAAVIAAVLVGALRPEVGRFDACFQFGCCLWHDQIIDPPATQHRARPAGGCHDMRRAAVRTFERAGVPRSVAMSIVGHKTESIYRRYAIVDEAMQREATARLDGWIAALGRHHQRPHLLPAGVAIDTGAASLGESGHPTLRCAGLILTAALVVMRLRTHCRSSHGQHVDRLSASACVAVSCRGAVGFKPTGADQRLPVLARGAGTSNRLDCAPTTVY